MIEIRWNTLDLPRWNELFRRIDDSNILQCYNYARVVRVRHFMNARWGQIFWDGVDVGLVQAHDVSLLFGVLHSIIIDRGPLFYRPVPAEAHAAFWAEINRLWPSRLGRKRRFMPELLDNAENDALLAHSGLKCRKMQKYSTIFVDFMPDIDEMRMKLRSNWRNHLKKAEKSGIIVDNSNDADDLTWFMREYAADRLNRRYRGPGIRTLAVMWDYFGQSDDRLFLVARSGDKRIAGALFFRHGASVTYQVGWADAEGRTLQAPSLLLWRAMLYFKERGVRSIDLGGIDDVHAAGVTDFKRGLNGNERTLVGWYC